LANETKQVLHNQITAGLMNLTSREAGAIVIAYEPVWAIGTGEFAKPDQVEEVVVYIRKQVSELFGERTAKHIRILYGGSVDEHNAASYLSLPGCDGALVGGASLHQHKFSQIVESAYRVQQKRSVR